MKPTNLACTIMFRLSVWFAMLYCIVVQGERLCNTRCFGHGDIAAGGCVCDYGYGPESGTAEALCSRRLGDHVPCTARQLQKGLATGDDTCCFGHGTIAPGGCACDYGYGPEQSDTEALCARDHVACTASQLQRAQQAGRVEECGGEHFPGSRLITAERGGNLDGWMPAKVKG